MIRAGFLTAAERRELRALARDGRSEGRVTRRANAMVLLDRGWSCAEVADALLIDDDTVRGWYELYEERGLAGLVVFDVGGSQSHLSQEQEAALFDWVRETLPRTTRTIGAWIAEMYGVEYSRPGLIALLHRLKIEYRKPDLVSRKLDAAKQKAFIEDYDRLMNGLGGDEAVVFVDAVHPTHQVRLVGCWAPEDEKIAIAPSSGRDRVNIHGAIDLETGKTQMLDVPSVDANSTILLLMAILAAYPSLRMSSSTRPATITPCWCVSGWPAKAEGSPSISCRPIALISTRSSGCGASCTETSPTTEATSHSETSRRP